MIPLLLGIDIGSTTAKAVLLRQEDEGAHLLVSSYRRHEARIGEALRSLANDVSGHLDGADVRVLVTGSSGMGVAERTGLPFVQEVHALCSLAVTKFPSSRVLLDVGGEDCKLVFLGSDGRVDARMNNGCAGGTGAFLDQMAALLSVETADFEALAAAGSQVHPIASRCGVFAKTDLQNLLSTGVSKQDAALSVFHALAIQVIAALARGRTVAGPVLMTGGPLTFLPTLRRVILERMRLEPSELILPVRGELACADGAALSSRTLGALIPGTGLAETMGKAGATVSLSTGEAPLFTNATEREDWMTTRFTPVPRVAPAKVEGALFLGIDSGSTTTKLVLVDEAGRMAASHYEMNHGEPLQAVSRGLTALCQAFDDCRLPVVRSAAVTGYGEDLLKTALGLEYGLVETSAHLRAAQALAPAVTFVLDIGGQDMKAIFVRDGQVSRVEVNEACSSGCGSFLQAFAETLNRPMHELAHAACHAVAPRALGSRCTVFMNSMVKQALREGASLEEIAAGLAYSVARNCLQKVLKLSDAALLGDTVVVQGGTFLNPAVQRAFEMLLGRQVICPDAAGLVGAWGAALWARDQAATNGGTERPLDSFAVPKVVSRKDVRCGGCGDRCPVAIVQFESGARHVSGNRCERAFRNGRSRTRGLNHVAAEMDLLLKRSLRPKDGAKGRRVGLPLALGMWENLPFWTSLLTGLGHEVVLSGPTDKDMVQQAIDTFCSDSVCLPARITSAHLVRLGALSVDLIFFPQVVHEATQTGAVASFNCPIVTGYPEVTAGTVPSTRLNGVPVFATPVSFRDIASLRRSSRLALQAAGLDLHGFDAAFDVALKEYDCFKERRRLIGQDAANQARAAGRHLVLLACRPYHIDPHLHHGVPEMLADQGYDVVSCQCLPEPDTLLEEARVLTQWAYPNRVLQAASWVASHDRTMMVQLNSFACGPDAVVADEAAAMLASKGRPYALLRIDESTAPGSIRLRLRTLEMNVQAAARRGGFERRSTPPYREQDRRRTLLTVPLNPLLSRVLGAEFGRLGFQLEVAPETDHRSLELGLKHVNNEICYPAILVIGDVLKALSSGRYPLSETAVLLTQTGGPCRASNYVPLLKKAMISAGFGNVPVVTIGAALNEQPGFRYHSFDLLKNGTQTIVVADALSMMAHSLAPREHVKGQAALEAGRLADEWAVQKHRGFAAALDFVERACREMAAVPVSRASRPRVGIVGEIYVKYSAYANRHLVDWLVDQRVEPVIPPLCNFFTQAPINAMANRRAGIDSRCLVPWLSGFVDAGIEAFLTALNRRLEAFPYPVHFPLPRELAAKASQVLSLIHQCGEGWLLGGEILDMADHGVNKVVCLQPFGCIANQVVARGIESRLRAERPGLDLLFLDLDHNTSEVNLFNRMRLLISPPPAPRALIQPSERKPDTAHSVVARDDSRIVRSDTICDTSLGMRATAETLPT
jgi:predicted CoA-substrate-specific enzyme activase